jgi:hypothetical protein
VEKLKYRRKFNPYLPRRNNMDFESIRALPLGDALQTVVVEGGATVGGFAAAGFAGRYIQNKVTPDSAIVSGTDKLKAWGSNNLPKIGLWYLLRKKRLLGEHTDLVNLGVVTSVALDTVLRLFNNGANPAAVTIGPAPGYQILGDAPGSTASAAGSDAGAIQRAVQEISALRADNARLRAAAPNIQTQQVPYAAQGPMDPRLPPYVGGGAGVSAAPGVVPPSERERRYAFMPGTAGAGTPGVPQTPGAAPRQRRYGFAGEPVPMSVGKPGAAYVQAGRMFGMQ